jgi:TorA maturation chaperone TorD
MSADSKARAPIYAWLAERVAREFECKSWKQMSRDPLRSILVKLEPSLEDALAEDLTPARKEAVDEEFARLFLLPGGVSPLASNWVSPQNDRESARAKITQWIEASFTALGRQPRRVKPWGKLPLDHLSVVLDLVAFSSISDRAADHEIAESLESDLLIPALSEFGPSLMNQAHAPIYRAIGALIVSLNDLA